MPGPLDDGQFPSAFSLQRFVAGGIGDDLLLSFGKRA